MSKVFQGRLWEGRIQSTQGTAAKMAVIQDAIRQADQAGDTYWRLLFRYEYACEATFRDDPPKAMPVSAEFAAIFEADPDALGPEGYEMYLMIMQMGIDPIVCLPQIPMEQWEALMDQFHALVKRYRFGLRTYWWQMCQFYMYVDKDKAFSYFQKFWKTGRDGLSDCRACERSHAVHMSLIMGDRKAADEYAKPLKAGRTHFCSDTPQLMWLAYLEDYLSRREWDAAAGQANALFRKGNRDKSDLSYLGAVLCAWARSDLDSAVALAERRLVWTLGMWDQKKRYDFYKGAWVTFQALAKQRDEVLLELPEQFPLWQASGRYLSAELAGWFYHQCSEIAGRFDARNGSGLFTDDLARTKRLNP